jgi:hypothetical protein
MKVSFSNKIKLGMMAAALAAAGVATAAVTFDSSTGMGFVGKGDVCTALGISNCKNPPLVNFSYSESFKVAQDCFTIVGNVRNPKRVENTYQRRSTVLSAINASVRNRGTGASGSSSQNEGYNLLGYGGTTEGWTDEDGVPVNGHTGTLCPTAYEPDPEGTNGGEMYVVEGFGGQFLTVTDGVASGVLAWPPVVTTTP